MSDPAPPPPPERAAAERQKQAPAAKPGASSPAPQRAKVDGTTIGKFRNTYYDFPSEGDYEGKRVPLMNAKCKLISDVAEGFHDAVCVQGSGTLTSGATVSFARRDCECARECPRTKQKICFDRLDASDFPWGRGATGKAITPLLTVAVDIEVIPLGTPIYIPEFDGIARDHNQNSFHDGCFVAQDRGLKIKGKHVDIFTGHESTTQLWNSLVPSNQGVTVVLESSRCLRASTP
jgi:3D (Asp-Asp-Asp) domain-containing protein